MHMCISDHVHEFSRCLVLAGGNGEVESRDHFAWFNVPVVAQVQLLALDPVREVSA